jgi:hypothetical protein
VQKTSATDRLLKAAAIRIRLSEFGRGFHLCAMYLTGIALVAVLCARLLSLLPDSWVTPLALLAVPVVALVGAVFFVRKTEPGDAARAVDNRAGSKELFLTAALIKKSPGEYRGIVAAQAEERASELSAARLLPFDWMRGARDIVLAGALLTAAVLWLPRLDPFRMAERRELTTKQEQRLAETKKITALRKDELKEKGAAASERIEQALAKLDKTLKDMKPQERELNAKKLNEEAQNFSDLWKRAEQQLPKNALDSLEKAAQSFGDAKDRLAMKELIEKLKKGDASGLKEAMEKLKKEMAEIAKMPEGADKKAALEKLGKELAKMTNQLKEQLGEKNLNEAMQRALEQMDMAKAKDLAKDALDAANESLNLSQEEMEKLAQAFKDADNLEDALKNLQMAKQLNEKGKLDGKDAEGAGAKTPADYEELYKKLMAQAGMGGDGDGNGDGQANGQPGRGKSGPNAGTGTGGNIGENEAAKTGLKDEKDPAKMGAGKLLMEWKEEGQGEKGTKAGEYEAAVRAVKEGVSEAIRNEQVPPGYHGTIQRYFDKLPTKAPAKVDAK